MRKKLPPDPLKTPLEGWSEKPMPPSVLAMVGDPTLEARYKAALKQWQAKRPVELGVQVAAKLPLLLAQYGIDSADENRWFELALCLAMEHVEGFSVAPDKAKRGRPEKWDATKLAALYCAVMQENDRREAIGLSSSVDDACRVLAKSSPWKELGSWKVLSNRFGESRSTPFVRYVKALHDDPRFGKKAYQMVAELGLDSDLGNAPKT